MGFNITPVVRNLLIINLIIWIIDSFIFRDLGVILALKPFNNEYFFPSQFFTYMFAHADFMHLFSNMLGLIVFGPMLEAVWGAKRFLFFYLFTGVGAALLYAGVNYYESYQVMQAADYYIQNPGPDNFSAFLQEIGKDLYNYHNRFVDAFFDNENNPEFIQKSIDMAMEIRTYKSDNSIMLGASGACLGVLAAFGLLFPNTELFLLFFPFPIKAKYLVIFYAVYSIYAGIRKAPGDNVAHFTHIGGMIFAFILVKYWNYNRKTFY